MLRSLLLTHSLPCSPWRKALSLPPRWHTFGLSEFWSYTALSFLPRCPSKESSDVWIFHVVIRVSSSWSPRRIGHYSVRLRNLSIVCVAILYKLYANATKVQRIFSMKPLCKLGGMIFSIHMFWFFFRSYFEKSTHFFVSSKGAFDIVSFHLQQYSSRRFLCDFREVQWQAYTILAPLSSPGSILDF